jgi:cytochrome c oxidase accessory protein FixG
MSPPIAPERVLPTLNNDGTRRKIRPRLYQGPRLTARKRTAWALMLLFAAAPLIHVGGKPLILLDVAQREFTFGGRTFLPTDSMLLMLLLLTLFVAVIWTTALVGRAWCGWACPQTVYMEFLFRPIERLFEGGREGQIRIDKSGGSFRRVAKNIVFLLVSFLVGNIFLAYFVGVKTLVAWAQLSPLEHWSPFSIVLATTGLVFFDFAYFREQMCTVICPYARIQSVLLDRRSLVVGYDKLRGEPRAKGKPRPGVGDCIDCSACVVTCPTGIDIRDGLQLECIACAQCADACDTIMAKIGKRSGLIRYGSQTTLETQEKTPIWRTRVAIYTALLAVALGSLVVFASVKSQAEVTVLRGIGAPFTLRGNDVISELRVKVRNRDAGPRNYRLSLVAAPTLQLIAPANPLDVAAGAQRTTAVFAVAPRESFAAGVRNIQVRVSDEQGFSIDVPYRLLGPEPGATP